MKDFLTQIVQALVDNPEQVQINQVEGTQTVVLELKVATSDMGKVIGKQGRTANAIRVLLNGASGKAGKRYVFEIVEWCGGTELGQEALDNDRKKNYL